MAERKQPKDRVCQVCGDVRPNVTAKEIKDHAYWCKEFLFAPCAHNSKVRS